MSEITKTRSLSLYPSDWQELDNLAEIIEEAVGYPVKAPCVVRNLLQYGHKLVREAQTVGLKRP